MRLIIHVTHQVDNEAEAEKLYEKIKKELRHHPALHINGQTTRKYVPSHRPGTPEEGPPT